MIWLVIPLLLNFAVSYILSTHLRFRITKNFFCNVQIVDFVIIIMILCKKLLYDFHRISVEFLRSFTWQTHRNQIISNIYENGVSRVKESDSLQERSKSNPSFWSRFFFLDTTLLSWFVIDVICCSQSGWVGQSKVGIMWNHMGVYYIRLSMNLKRFWNVWWSLFRFQFNFLLIQVITFWGSISPLEISSCRKMKRLNRIAEYLIVNSWGY